MSIFFRALADLMPAVTSLPQASADAIRQSSADLASGTAVQRAVEDALRAVGLPAGATTRPNDNVHCDAHGPTTARPAAPG